MLSAVEASGAHAIRLILCRQLAELLLRGLAGMSYTPPSGNWILCVRQSVLERLIESRFQIIEKH